MTGNIRIVSQNHLEGHAISAAPTPAAPASYLLNPLREYRWQSLDASQQVLTGNLGSTSKTVSAVVLWNHNLTAASTWRIELFSGQNQTGSKVYDSAPTATYTVTAFGDLDFGVDPLGAVLVSGQTQPASYAVAWISRIACKSWRITLEDAANPSGYLAASRLIVGDYWEPEENIDYGYTFRWLDGSTLYRTEGGSLRADSQEPTRELSVALSRLPEAERAALTEIYRVCGKRKDIFVSLYPGEGGAAERDHSFLARITGDQASTSLLFARFADQMVFSEC
jgi:hypothetical protein